MKFLLVALLIGAVAAKSELKVKNTCDNPLVKIVEADDEKSGAVTPDSVLLLDFDTREDTWSKDPFDEVSEVLVYKWFFGAYRKVPNFLLNVVCKKAEADFKGKVKCLGNGEKGYKINIPCTFKDAVGHCLPQVGKSHVRFPIHPPMQMLKQLFNGIFAGWVKVQLTTTSPISDTELFCVEAEAKVDI